MTQDESIELARQAGIVVTGDAVLKLCQLVAEKEREACALICEKTKADVITGNAVEAFNYATKYLANLIRARGQA
jgi:hypothetical protein